jgi:hypothetical protein
MMTAHWKILTPSQFEHERRALDFVRAGLPDHEPYRAWANFEFQSNDGALYEVDLLVLSREGFWLVEIKSRPGKVEGDVGTWTWTTPEGRRLTEDNPIYLAASRQRIVELFPTAHRRVIGPPTRQSGVEVRGGAGALAVAMSQTRFPIDQAHLPGLLVRR